MNHRQFVMKLMQDQSVTPWNQQDNHLHSLKILKNRDFSLPFKSKSPQDRSPKSKVRDFGVINKILRKRQPFIKVDKRILARTQTIQFELLENDAKYLSKLKCQREHSTHRLPSCQSNPALRLKQPTKREGAKTKEKQRCNSSDIRKSKYNGDFHRIQSIKRKQFVLSTGKNFFQPIESRSKQKFSNRVGEVLSIVRRAMHKEGAFAKIIKRRERSCLKEFQRSNLLEKL